MNKKYIVLLCAVFCSTLCCAAFKQILPSPKGQGPDILLINGGRPWVGEETANIFIRNGYRVTLLDSIHLAGLGGAPIRFFLTDKEEPQPFDGITPAFKKSESLQLGCHQCR